MIGASNTQSALGGIAPEYGISISPGSINVVSSNGSASSPIAYATVINGVGPFTYAWIITGSDIGIDSPMNSDTAFSSSGFNVVYAEVATLTVTDTGNGNAEISKDIDVTFRFIV